jgi:predicted nucleotide-binding protein
LSTPSPGSEETPLLEEMRAVVRILREQLADPNFQPRRAAREANRFRLLLKKIYGENSPQIAGLPILRLEDLTGDIKTQLIRRLEIGESILNTLGVMTGLANGGRRVFIGHGRSPIWRELKDFMQDRLSLSWDEFNREAVAGVGTSERLQIMLNSASFAFLVLTAEEEHTDSTIHARPNVIHEVGLFQGKLGMRRAIVLLEEGCSEFSNIAGLGQIRFPKGNIAATFEDIRRVLEREHVI